MKLLCRWANNLNSAFWNKVGNAFNISDASLSVFRILAAAFLLIFHFYTYSWISGGLQALFNPPYLSLGNLLNNFPPRPFFITLDIVLLLSLTGVLLGVKARYSTLLYVLASFIGLNFRYSYGKIDNIVLLQASLLLLSFSNWGTQLALLPDKRREGDANKKSLALLCVFICFGMFTAGIQKVFVWIDFDPDNNGFASWFYYFYFFQDRQQLLAPYVFKIPYRYLDVIDYTGVAFELSAFFFLLRSRRAWYLWLMLASFFHLVNALLLNIAFLSHVTVYSVFIDWKWLYLVFRDLWRKKYVRVYSFIFLFAVVMLRVVFVFQNKHYINLLFLRKGGENLFFSVVIWTFMVVAFAWMSFSRRKNLSQVDRFHYNRY